MGIIKCRRSPGKTKKWENTSRYVTPGYYNEKALEQSRVEELIHDFIFISLS